MLFTLITGSQCQKPEFTETYINIPAVTCHPGYHILYINIMDQCISVCLLTVSYRFKQVSCNHLNKMPSLSAPDSTVSKFIYKI